MENVLVIFQDIIRYPLSAVTRKQKIQYVIKNAGKKPVEKSIQNIPSY